MDSFASKASLQTDIASASQAASDIQDDINEARGSISEDSAQANAEAQKALDESRQDLNRDRSGEVCSSGGGTC